MTEFETPRANAVQDFAGWVQAYRPELMQLYQLHQLGAEKHGAFGYLGREVAEHHAHAYNHLREKASHGGTADPRAVDAETGLPHSLHCALRCLFEQRLLRYWREGK